MMMNPFRGNPRSMAVSPTTPGDWAKLRGPGPMRTMCRWHGDLGGVEHIIFTSLGAVFILGK